MRLVQTYSFAREWLQQGGLQGSGVDQEGSMDATNLWDEEDIARQHQGRDVNLWIKKPGNTGFFYGSQLTAIYLSADIFSGRVGISLPATSLPSALFAIKP